MNLGGEKNLNKPRERTLKDAEDFFFSLKNEKEMGARVEEMGPTYFKLGSKFLKINIKNASIRKYRIFTAMLLSHVELTLLNSLLKCLDYLM